LADFIVENSQFSILDDENLTILYNGQNEPIFAWWTTDFCWPILLADKISQLYQSSDIRRGLAKHMLSCSILAKPLSHIYLCIASILNLNITDNRREQFSKELL